MRTIQLIAMAVVTFTSIPFMAQQIDANGQQNASATAGRSNLGESGQTNANANVNGRHAQAGGAGDSSATATGRHGRTSANGAANSATTADGLRSAASSTNGSAAAAEEMRPVKGELESKLDSRTAKTGDPVIMKTTQKMKTADGTEIPKGSRLVGHVTSAQAHTKGHAESELGIAFDRAELRNGQSIPIHSMIESVGPRPNDMMDSPMADDGFGAGMGGGGMAGGGPVMAGGGGMGNVGGGGAMGGVAQTGGRVGEGMGRNLGGAVDGTANATGRVAGNAAGAMNGVNAQMRGATGATGSLAAHATGFPGVMLSGDATGTASGMLSAAKKNIHLNSGTQMVLGVAAAK